MMRLLFGVLVAIGLSALIPTESFAHGGQFRGPGGSVPPDLREPKDPTPPPPPPPPSGGSNPPSGGPTTPGTPPAAPTPPPVTTPGTGGEDPTAGRGRQGGTGFADWTFWYHHNKEEIENLKRRLYFSVSSDNPLSQIGGGNVTNRGSATRLTQRKVEDAIIPALLWAMNPKNSGFNDTESAAYIALAKVARTPDHVQRIRRGLEKGPEKDRVVQEAAALALGLLRRGAADDQFSARELDGVRATLFAVFEDADYSTFARGYAALAIGLLGDQPTGSADYLQSAGKSLPPTPAADGPGLGAGDDARQIAERITTERLFRLLAGDHANADLAIGLLMAIGLQPSSSVTEAMRAELGTKCVLRGRLFGNEATGLIRGHAALTLARIGGESEIGPLQHVLVGRGRFDSDTIRSAAIGLGILGRSVASERREAIARTLIQHGVDKPKDDTVRNFSIVSLADLLVAEVREGKTALLKLVGPELLKQGESGSYYQRPFGALALALVVAQVTDENATEAWQEFKSAALKVLRTGLDDAKMDKKSRAAFATALGIARDSSQRARLVQIVGDRRENKELRAYAALALGLIGESSAEVTQAIAVALRERSSEELRRQAAVALGLLGNPKIGGTGQDAIQLLLAELQTAESQAHKGPVVVALARIGNDKAVDPLVGLLKDTTEQDLTQALACAGLGIVGDLEWIPSLSRLSRDVNYRLSTDLLNEVLSIL